MRIFLGRVAVRCPSRPSLQAAAMDGGQTGRVATTTLEMSTTTEDDPGRCAGPHVVDDAAHVQRLPVALTRQDSRTAARSMLDSALGAIRGPGVRETST